MRSVLERPGTAVDEITRMLSHTPSITGSDRMDAIRKGEKAEEGVKIVNRLKHILDPMMDRGLITPAFNDANSFAVATVEQIVGNRVGRISYEGNQARLHWFTKRKESGVLSNDWFLERHEHLVLNPRFSPLPSVIPLPKEARRIHDEICKEPALRDITRIMEGDLLGESHGDVEQWNERTKLGIAADKAREAAQRTARLAQQAGSAAVTTLGAIPAAVADIFANDPALVIGDIVLYGWR